MINNKPMNQKPEDPEEIFSSQLDEISQIEYKSDIEDFYSDMTDLINAVEKKEKEEKLTIHDFQPNLNSNKITQPENQSFLLDDEQFTPTNGETKKKEDKKEAITTFIKALKKTVNKVAEKSWEKIKISLKKLDSFLASNSLEKIGKKDLETIFCTLNPKNRSIIETIRKKLKGKNGQVAFEVLMKIPLAEMYDYYEKDCKLIFYDMHFINLTGKFETLKDISEKKCKKLRRLRLKKIQKKKKDDEKMDEKPMEIEKEVFEIVI